MRCQRLAATAVVFLVTSSAGSSYGDDGPGEQVQVTKSPDREDAVDVTITLEEEDRHRLEYGGGISQSDGIFGNVSYTNTNLLGRGEMLGLVAQKGTRSSTYRLSFTEPYLFGRTGVGIELFRSRTNFLATSSLGGYREARNGANVTVSRALRKHANVSLMYAYEGIDTSIEQSVLEGLTGESAGPHRESRLTPAFAYDTRDDTLMPRRGRRITARAAFAGGPLGGSTNYIRPEFEAVQYVPLTPRTAFGLRVNAGWVKPFGGTDRVPYYLRYFLGGTDQIRGVDLRTVGPTDSQNRLIGGDKFALFNAEYYVDLHRRVRLVLFHDAGQAFSETQPIDARQLRSSSGIELRVTLPKLNVPIRLIYGWNTDRDGLQPAGAFKFAFGMAF